MFVLLDKHDGLNVFDLEYLTALDCLVLAYTPLRDKFHGIGFKDTFHGILYRNTFHNSNSKDTFPSFGFNGTFPNIGSSDAVPSVGSSNTFRQRPADQFAACQPVNPGLTGRAS